MSKADLLKSYQPDYYREVDEMDAILETEGTEFEEYEVERDRTQDNLYIDTSDDEGLSRWEAIFSIIPPVGSTLSERASVIKQFLRGVEKLSGTSIQNIALAYTNGDTEVSFDGVNSVIIVEFTNIVGIPSNVDALEAYLNERKPAHIGINYIFLFNTHDVLALYTHDYLAGFTHDELYDTDLTP